jgi:Zn finger protein HypA/HybF involved in hydrogenase expression
MHEMSVALEVLSIVEQHVGTESLGTVSKVGLEVGDEAGVVLESLEFCLAVLLAAAPFDSAKADVERVDGDTLRVTYLEVEDGRT